MKFHRYVLVAGRLLHTLLAITLGLLVGWAIITFWHSFLPSATSEGDEAYFLYSVLSPALALLPALTLGSLEFISRNFFSFWSKVLISLIWFFWWVYVLPELKNAGAIGEMETMWGEILLSSLCQIAVILLFYLVWHFWFRVK